MNDALRAWLDDKTYLMNILSHMGVDVAEVVRCKDCIYALGKVNRNNVICNRQDWATVWKADDYCSYGKRI